VIRDPRADFEIERHENSYPSHALKLFQLFGTLGCRVAASPAEDHLRDHFALDCKCHLWMMVNIVHKLQSTTSIILKCELSSNWFHHKVGEVC
jgi:hypothetical protein